MRRFQHAVGVGALHAVLISGALVMVLPFLWMISTALKPEAEVLSRTIRLIPQHPTLANFGGVFRAAPFGRYFMNSLIMSVISTITIVLSSAIAGYVLAKFTFPGRTALFVVILATAIVPFEIYMIPLYLTMNDLGLVNTMRGMVLPYLIMSFGIFFMRQNIIASIPDDLLMAARVDGASELRIFTQIVRPLLGAASSALSIFAFMQAWTAFIWPLLIANKKDLYTMELGLAMFQSGFSIDFALTAAGSVISIVPMVVMFVLMRRQIIEGITLTGLKG
ncbi:MAG: carbohydrate ABC transporter permease [Herpetosiphon sp.]